MNPIIHPDDLRQPKLITKAMYRSDAPMDWASIPLPDFHRLPEKPVGKSYALVVPHAGECPEIAPGALHGDGIWLAGRPGVYAPITVSQKGHTLLRDVFNVCSPNGGCVEWTVVKGREDFWKDGLCGLDLGVGDMGNYPLLSSYFLYACPRKILDCAKTWIEYTGSTNPRLGFFTAIREEGGREEETKFKVTVEVDESGRLRYSLWSIKSFFRTRRIHQSEWVGRDDDPIDPAIAQKDLRAFVSRVLEHFNEDPDNFTLQPWKDPFSALLRCKNDKDRAMGVFFDRFFGPHLIIKTAIPDIVALLRLKGKSVLLQYVPTKHIRHGAGQIMTNQVRCMCELSAQPTITWQEYAPKFEELAETYFPRRCPPGQKEERCAATHCVSAHTGALRNRALAFLDAHYDLPVLTGHCTSRPQKLADLCRDRLNKMFSPFFVDCQLRVDNPRFYVLQCLFWDRIHRLRSMPEGVEQKETQHRLFCRVDRHGTPNNACRRCSNKYVTLNRPGICEVPEFYPTDMNLLKPGQGSWAPASSNVSTQSTTSSIEE